MLNVTVYKGDHTPDQSICLADPNGLALECKLLKLMQEFQSAVGPETKEITQVVDFSIHVSGASTA